MISSSKIPQKWWCFVMSGEEIPIPRVPRVPTRGAVAQTRRSQVSFSDARSLIRPSRCSRSLSVTWCFVSERSYLSLVWPIAILLEYVWISVSGVFGYCVDMLDLLGFGCCYMCLICLGVRSHPSLIDPDLNLYSVLLVMFQAQLGYYAQSIPKPWPPDLLSTGNVFPGKEPSLMACAATNLSFLYFLEAEHVNAEKYADIAVKADRYNARALVNKGNCCLVPFWAVPKGTGLWNLWV